MMGKRRKHETKAEIVSKLEEHRKKRAEARGDMVRLIATGADAELIEGGTAVRARRIDVFQLLYERRAIPQVSFDAVRSYEHDMALSMGWETPERTGDFVSRSCEGAPGQNVTQEMIDASRRIQRVRATLSRRDVALLDNLLADHGALLTRWRDTVHRITGETNDDAHTAVIRAMVHNLSEAMRAGEREAA